MRPSGLPFWKRCWLGFSQIAGGLACLMLSLGLPLHLALEPDSHGPASFTGQAIDFGTGAEAHTGIEAEHESPGEPAEHPASERELASVSRLSVTGHWGVVLPSDWTWRDDFRPVEAVVVVAAVNWGGRPARTTPPDSPRGPPRG